MPPVQEAPTLSVITGFSEPPAKALASYPGGNGAGRHSGAGGDHFCTQGPRFDQMQKSIGQLSMEVRSNHMSEENQLKDVQDSLARVLEEVVAVGHRVGKVGNDPTSEAEATGLTKALLHNTNKINEIERRVDTAFDSIHDIKREDDNSGVYNLEQLQQKYHEVKGELQLAKSKEEKRQEAWRGNVVKILVLLAVGGGGVEAVRQIVTLFMH